MTLSDRKSFDTELNAVHEWIGRAGRALLSFVDIDRGVFWRDNDKKAAKGIGESPTSTRRSFVALVSALHAVEEENTKRTTVIDINRDEAVRVLQAVVERYLDREVDAVRLGGKQNLNTFMDAQLLVAAAMLKPLRMRSIVPKGTDVDQLIGRFAPVVADLHKELKLHRGVPMRYDENAPPHADDEAPHRHDFITLHAVRGLDACNSSIDEGVKLRLQKRLRNDVLRQLGYKVADVSSRFDPSELAFTITLLNRFPTPDTEPLTEAAVDVIVQAQLPSGAWPPARPVVYSHTDILHIASFDVALSLSYLLRGQATRRNAPFRDQLLAALGAMFKLIKSSYRKTEDAEGWCNDHARSPDLIESWATAVVLMFLTQYRELLLESHQDGILEKYHAARDTRRGNSAALWCDMDSLLNQPDQANIAELEKLSDPTSNRELTKAVREKFFRPIRESWLHKPGKAASLILYGPPGTRKTSLVKQLARSLEWPLVEITPPDFLQRGLDGFEAAAADVFEDLFRLRRVVVFFDECEDFFKQRPPDQKLESRTIGAFITAGMLPRLQKLRDRGWVIFVVATNSDLDDLDPAVTRPGRFDFSYKMMNPTVTAAKRYVVSRLKEESRDDFVSDAEAALDMRDFSDDLPSFTILERLVRDLVEKKVSPGAGEIRELFDDLCKRTWPEDLVPR